MQVTVKYFASLKDVMGIAEENVTINDAISVGELWKHVSNKKNITGTILMAQNMSYVHADVLLNDGDEVAFFPPVTGG